MLSRKTAPFLWLPVLCSGSIHAAPMFTPEVKVKQVSADCGQPRIYATSPGDANPMSLVVEFSDLQVLTQDQLQVTRDCQIAVAVKVPPFKRFRATKAIADGEFFISETGFASVDISYQWMNEMASNFLFFDKVTAKNPDNFIIEALGDEEWPFTKCSSRPQDMEMSGRFEITAARGEHDLNNTDIALFNAETIVSSASRKMRSVWQWDWQDCQPDADANPWQKKTFKSSYSTANGSWVQGTTEFSGSGGSYQTNAGQTGTFSNVVYSQDLQKVEGLWTFADGGSGWFSFALNSSQKSFAGNWGFGSDIGKNKKGQWKGERRD